MLPFPILRWGFRRTWYLLTGSRRVGPEGRPACFRAAFPAIGSRRTAADLARWTTLPSRRTYGRINATISSTL